MLCGNTQKLLILAERHNDPPGYADPVLNGDVKKRLEMGRKQPVRIRSRAGRISSPDHRKIFQNGLCINWGTFQRLNAFHSFDKGVFAI